MKSVKSIARWLFWLAVWPIAALLPSQTEYKFHLRLGLAFMGVVLATLAVCIFLLTKPLLGQGFFGILLAIASNVMFFFPYAFACFCFLGEREDFYKDKNLKSMSDSAID